jgi:hypothetical protein
LKSAWANSSRDPIFKIPNTTRAGGVAQVVECLPSKCEALSSNASTTWGGGQKEKRKETMYLLSHTQNGCHHKQSH